MALGEPPVGHDDDVHHQLQTLVFFIIYIWNKVGDSDWLLQFSESCGFSERTSQQEKGGIFNKAAKHII